MHDLIDKIICGDCIDILNNTEDKFADLIFADPPFNIGYQYDKYDDNLDKNNYLDWSSRWIDACLNVLKPSGSFYIAIGNRYAAEIKIRAEQKGLVLRNWIIWHYTFGQQTQNMFAKSHTHIFYFVRDAKCFTFNDYSVRVPSDRQLIYKDRRANPKGKLPDDVWDTYPRICGTFRERTGWHPCQMPESLLYRIVAASSNRGDCVLDPFCGSGTTLAAAYKLGRRYTGIDISEDYARNANKRIEQIVQQQKEYGKDTVVNQCRQLLADTGLEPGKILDSKALLEIFTEQLKIRINDQSLVSLKQVEQALRRLK